MKILLFILLFPFAANAVEFEFGTGATHYKKAHDGLWYQESQAHNFDLKSVPMSLGVSHKSGNLRYRAEYIYLGWMYSSAVWSSDGNYYAGSNAEPIYIGTGKGSAAGLLLSVSRDINLFGLPFYGEVGPFIYTPQWKVEIRDYKTNDFLYDLEAKSKLRIGYAIGFGIRHSGIDISIKYLGMQYNQGEPYPPIFDHAYVLETKVYF